MNHHHRKILHAIFAHPVSNNIGFKEVEHLFGELGATIDNKSGNRIGVVLNGHTVALTHAQHDLPKEEVLQIKKFLTSCGIKPEDYPV